MRAAVVSTARLALAGAALSLAACAGRATPSAPPPRDPAVSPAIRASVGTLRPELRSLAGEGSIAVAVMAGGTLVWTEAFGTDSVGAPARPDAAYPLDEFTDLIAAASALHWLTMATDRELRSLDLPPATEWSCRTLSPLWSGGPSEWPRPAAALLLRAGAGGVRTTRGCEGWRASAPDLARLGAALADGALLGDRASAWLLEDRAVRTARSAGAAGAAALLLDRGSNMAVVLMTDQGGAGAALEQLVGRIHARVRARLSPPGPP